MKRRAETISAYFSDQMNYLKSILDYLWSGWGALSSLFLLMALWEIGNHFYGSFILPTPIESFNALMVELRSEKGWSYVWVSTQRAISGFLLSILVGSVLGILSGLSITASRAARPIVTFILGVPPISWIVLALMWFGMGGMTPIFTVLVTTLPLTFASAVQGTRTLDHRFLDMSTIYKVPFGMKLWDFYLPHILSYLFPAWINALGMAWKVTIMAELLAANDGIGAGMALARVNLETATAMGWILATVILLLAFEYLCLEPLKRHFESWRQESPAMGMKP